MIRDQRGFICHVFTAQPIPAYERPYRTWFYSLFPCLVPSVRQPRPYIGQSLSFLSILHSVLFCSRFPQLRRQSHPPQRLRLFVAENLPFYQLFCGCQVPRCPVERNIQVSLQHNPPPPQQPAEFTALWQRFPSIAAAAHPYSAANRRTSCRFLSSVFHNRSFPQLSSSDTPLNGSYACFPCLFIIGFACSKHCLFSPTLWRDWRHPATKHPFPPHIQHILPVLSLPPAILPTPPASPAHSRRRDSRRAAWDHQKGCGR